MDNLEPITRNEMFLNGDDLEPITREEMILAGADLEPITRHEWFLKRYRGGGGGGGYDLVNVPNLPADIASFNDGTDLPMASLKVAVTPYQDLSHGDPSPSNICPIIGWDEAVVTVADDAESPTTSHEYTIDLDGTRYGGTLDVVSGVLTVDRAIKDLGSLSWTYYTSGNKNLFYATINDKKNGGFNNDICSAYKPYPNNVNSIATASSVLSDGEFTGFSNTSYQYSYIFVRNDLYDNTTDFTTHTNGIKLVYELTTPTTIHLTPTQVKSLEGTNNIFANCGQITEGKYFKKA